LSHVEDTIPSIARSGMSPQGESPLTKEQLLAYYGEVCRSHNAITDFRAKLLALLPIASGAGIGLLATQAKGEIPTWLPVVLGTFGALVTVGLFFYEFHQMDDCQQLRSHGVWIENQLGIPAGQFRSKRGKLGLRHIWPPNYRERDEQLMKPEREGTPPDEYKPGSVNVRNADYIVYGAVFLAWIAVLAWGITKAL
jgi:hypothetical protein